jgi:hypothetical protein
MIINNEKLRLFILSLWLAVISIQETAAVPCPIKEEAAPSFTKEVYRITRASSWIKIDGILNEEAWKNALIIPLNYEVFPGDNTEPLVKTECLLTYNTSYLYVAFRAFEPDPSMLRAHFSERDQILQDDRVGIVLDTFNDQNRAFLFAINALGIQRDLIYSNGGRDWDDSWDAIWDSATRITDFGYVGEIAIPFCALQFPQKEELTWGVQLFRYYPRNKNYLIQNNPDNRNEECEVCKFAKITGLKAIKPGKQMEMDPTLTGTKSHQRENFPHGSLKEIKSSIAPGISVHWGLTPNLTLSGAINPDFSQVEADAAQLDINTQFALYYPEKRPFFLEGLDFFKTRADAVYTRTIADPDWGLKLSGKQGKNVIGFFTARDHITNFLLPGAQGSTSAYLTQPSYASVMRYRRDLGSSSTLGLIVTDREGKDYHNRVLGIDGLIQFSKSDSLDFQLLGSHTLYPGNVSETFNQNKDGFSGTAFSVSYSRTKRSYYWRGWYYDYSPGFRADLGYIPQVDFRQLDAKLGYVYWGKKHDFFSLINIESYFGQMEDHSRHLLERNGSLEFYLEGPLQSVLTLELGASKKVFNSTAFKQMFGNLNIEIKPTGDLYLNCFFSLGDEIDYIHTRAGKKLQIISQISYNLGRHLSISLNYDAHRLRIHGQRLFLAQLAEMHLTYHLNKRTFFRGIVQYSAIKRNTELYSGEVQAISKDLFTQFLFSYKVNPRTVLFLGYNDDYLGYGDIPLTQTNRTFFIKIGYALTL